MNDSALLAAAVVIAAAVYFAMPDMSGGYDQETGEADFSPDLEDYGYQAAESMTGFFQGEESGEDMDRNTAAFLRAIRVGEGTSAGNGYSVLCGGGTFDSFENHPALLGWRGFPLSSAQCAGAGFGPGCVSTAAGAYQINRPTWNRIASKIGLGDFGPANQDRAALELIREKGALADVSAGRIAAAVVKVAKVWASLPGAGYGQREVALSAFARDYQQAGGILA